jgi:hypothetical protein
MLSEKKSKKILKIEKESEFKVTIKLPTLFSLLITGCGRLDAALYLPFVPAPIEKKSGIWGCNWSIHKKDLYAVNGFDEDYVAAGIGEDTDIHNSQPSLKIFSAFVQAENFECAGDGAQFFNNFFKA